VTLDHVLDFAEIPAFTERRAIDQAGDANGDVSDAEAAAYAERTCAAQIGSLTLTLDGAALPLSSTGSAILFPPGQAGALTQRLVCPYVATPPSVLAGPATVAFSDVSYSDRIGWREIVVEGDRVAISGSTANTTTSARLTSYPTDLLAEPLRQSSVTFQVTPGAAALAPFFPPSSPHHRPRHRPTRPAVPHRARRRRPQAARRRAPVVRQRPAAPVRRRRAAAKRPAPRSPVAGRTSASRCASWCRRVT
jgi:hypothetical protein